MGKVYRHRPAAPDELLGSIDPVSGVVYASRFGFDRRIGKVDLYTGKVFRVRLGPDKYLGRVKLESGDVYLHRHGPDRYIGRAKSDGTLYRHVPMRRDMYLGRVAEMESLAEGGAALLLFFVDDLESTEADLDGSAP